MNQRKIGIVLNYLTIILTFIIGLIYTPYLIRILGQESYGVYSLAFAIAGYFSLLDLGIGNSIVRYVSINIINGTKEKEGQLIGFFVKIFSGLGLISILLGVSLYFSSEMIVSSDFNDKQINDLKWIILILSLNFAISFIVNIYNSILQAYERFFFLKLINIFRQVLIPLVSVITLYFSKEVVYLAIILIVINTLASITSYLYYRRYLYTKILFTNLGKEFKKDILTYSLTVFVVAIADKLYWQTDQILLGILSKPEEVAIFAVSIQLVNIFMSLSVAINGVFLPKISKLVQGENYSKELNRLYIIVSRIQCFIIGLAFSGFILFGKEFIGLWIGIEYNEVYLITIILLSSFVIDLIQNLGIVVMQAQGKYIFRAYLLIICSILNIVISMPIIMRYGSIGTAIVTALFVFIGNVFILNFYFHLKVKLNMIRYWKVIGKQIITIVIMGLIVYFVPFDISTNSWAHLLFALMLYTFYYTLINYLFILDKHEKKVILEYVNKKFRRAV